MSLLPTIQALGTSWWIEIFDDMTEENTEVVYDDLRVFIATFEARYSRFRPDSLISQLNQTGRLTNPDQALRDILSYGLTLYTETNGVFNFLVGEVLEKQGYDAKYSFQAQSEKIIIPDPETALSISETEIILRAGHIDLGGYGKGYLIDLLAERLKTVHHCSEFLINGGGDMYGTSEGGKAINIYLEHPTEKNTYLKETTILHEGFAASSTHKRRWKSDGQTYTHIIDTVAGGSNTSALAMFVKAPTAVTADVWATTLLISPPANHHAKMQEKSIRAAWYDPQNKTLHEVGGFFKN